ncbi:DHA2 family efflux MFS transporter permease subunit [Domibacillus tundrae]|uniref:DHA2 family efflux MFS transporter permease subunit n=1 Tax=Domibacillus tundrae TaxID=1587527 RepID=UPI000617F005|nr:DHA2 family efflux MFS transporter permease subunit [Domibacillus tundrae]
MSEKRETEFWSIIFAVFFGNFLAVMNTSTINVAVPAFMKEFHTDLPAAQWTVTGFMLAAGAVAPAAGWFGARFGFKRVYISALMGFFVCSFVSVFAWSIESLIVLRILQGLFSGMIMPSTMTLVYKTIEREKQAYGISLWSLSAVLAPALGPVLAGFFIDAAGWPALFYLNLPIAAAAIWAAAVFIPGTDAGAKMPFDLPGLILSFSGSILLLTAFAEAESWGFTDAKTLAVAGVALVLLFLFVRREMRVQFPLLNFEVLSHRRYAFSLMLSSVMSVGLYAGAFLVPIFLQRSLGLGALETGLIMMPGALVMALFTPVTGKLYDKTGPAPLILAGLIVMIAGTYMMGNLSIETTMLYVIIWTSVRYLGIALCNMPITNVGMSAIPIEMTGYASALNNWARQSIASLSIALFSALLAFRSSIYAGQGADAHASSAIAAGNVFLYSLLPLVVALPLVGLLKEKKRTVNKG